VINGVVTGIVFMAGLALYRHFESEWIINVAMYSMIGGAAAICGAAYRQGWKDAIRASPPGKSTGDE
jgi:general stress protein CsbA